MTESSLTLSDAAITQVKAMLAQRQIIDARLQAFLEGVIAGKGMDGQWNLDTTKWELTKQIPPERQKDG